MILTDPLIRDLWGLIQEHLSEMNVVGLSLNFVGSVLVGVVGVKGLAAGFVWKSDWWKASWGLGWALLAVGFALKLFAAYLGTS